LNRSIGAALRKEAEAASGKDSGPISRNTQLSDTGLDSIGFATLIVDLENQLGRDPFGGSAEIIYPETFGDLVDLYSAALR